MLTSAFIFCSSMEVLTWGRGRIYTFLEHGDQNLRQFLGRSACNALLLVETDD